MQRFWVEYNVREVRKIVRNIKNNLLPGLRKRMQYSLME